MCFPLSMMADITTYTFTSKSWASVVTATKCDGTTDGWVCDKEAYGYSKGSYDAEKLPWSWGVDVKKSTYGAGATSVQSFTDVSRITFNFCQNKSGGKGTIYVKVGDNAEQSLVITRPKDGKGDYNRDSIVTFSSSQTGKISFRVECTENAIYINSISIRSGGSSSFYTETYRLVTDVNQLQDNDQVIFGVYKDGLDYIMGYYDEWVSVNNIHAIQGRYADNRNTVSANDEAIYTLHVTELNGKKAYILQDELRYEEAYLVASGGQTKNRLALWTDVVSEKSYGNYGYWDIAIQNGGEAVITNLGNSLSKIIQYNASDHLFACYKDRSQTPICLYRREEGSGDQPAIVAPFVNFGTTLKQTDQRTITVNAHQLAADISASLKKGEVFSISSDKLNRDGDELTISYTDIAKAGHYADTLILQSGSVEKRVAIVLNRMNPMSIKEAVQQDDHTVTYLNEVVVTKKYNNYIYVRDETGSMLLFDRGEEGKRYGSKVDEGYRLTGVTGRFINYYGVPEISPSEQFKYQKDAEVSPETAPAVIDSADVCRYLLLENAVVNGWTELTYKGKTYAVNNKFNLSSFTTGVPTRTYVIVSYDYDVVTLYIIKQEIASGIDDAVSEPSSAGRRLIMREGVVLVETEDGYYTLQGEKIF
jgi:hypothetical protein